MLSVSDKDGGTATASFSLAVPPGSSTAGAPTPSGFRAARLPAETTATAAITALAPQQAAPPTSPRPAEPVPAIVIDRVAAATGELIEIRNATRVDGAPAGSTLDPGDGRPPITLAAGGTVHLAYFAPGEPVLTVAASSGGTRAGSAMYGDRRPDSRRRRVRRERRRPHSAPQPRSPPGATSAGGTDLPGVLVQFTLGTESVEAVTGADGVARAELPVTGPTGARDLVVLALPDGAPVTSGFTVTSNAVPVADAGGAYSVGVGSPLDLVGSGTDTDVGEQATLAYQWDLDRDGEYDDASEPTPSLSSERVRTLLCRGTCDAGETAMVALRVTDAKGGYAVDTAVVTLIRDFALTINPATATLVPDANVSFTVSVVTSNGFTGPVTLSAPGLPPGITATFDPATVTPDGTSLLNLSAGASFVPQDFPLVVRGTSDAIVRETGTTMSLEFGLVPQCFGTVTGRITDEVTGAGLGGVAVLGTVTDANGDYTATGLTLDAGNAPRLIVISTLGSDFYPLSSAATVRIACGITQRLDIVVLPRQYGAIAGTITGIDVDGTPLGPIANAEFALNRRTGADGGYSLTNLRLGAGNSPIDVSVTAKATGYHNRTATTQISAGTTSTLDITLRKVCTASVRIRVLDARTRRAVAGARVDTGQGSSGFTTDLNGIATFPAVAARAHPTISPSYGPSERSRRPE